jgi:glycosyltransferase involved in cell wall biosynthesis
MLPQPRAASGNVTISVVMPAYNCCTLIDRSLAPLLEMRREGEICEIIVVDDGSTDGTADVAASLDVRLVSTGGRCRQAAARNLGARAARGDILWFVDADVVAKADAARQVLQALANRNCTAVFGSYDDSPTAQNFLSQYKNLVHHHYHQNIRRDVSTFWAGCGAVWKDAFLAVGGFDADIPGAIEDIELGYRLRAAGGRIRQAPELQGTHLKVWTFRRLMITELRDRAIPWSFLLLSRARLGDELNVAVTERIRALVACLGFAMLVASLAGFVSWWMPVILIVIAFAANLELFALFQRRNGLLFAIGGMLFHQFYYLYSTATYCWCWAVVKTGKLISSPGRGTEALRD